MAHTSQQYVDAIRRAKAANRPDVADSLAEDAARLFPDGPEIKNQSMVSNADSAIIDNIIGAGETALTMAKEQGSLPMSQKVKKVSSLLTLLASSLKTSQ